MPDPVQTTPDNTNVAPTTDVKPSGSALTGAEPQNPVTTPAEPTAADKAVADAAAAKAKADADAGKTPEQIKAEADKAAEDKAKADAEKAKTGAPADGKYEFKFAGAEKLDPELTTKFTGIAKELNLSVADAQKLAELGPVLVAKQTEALTNQWNKTREAWVTDQKADKTLGGENYSKSLEIGNRGVAAILKVAPELKQAIDMGLLDQPGIWKGFIYLGKILGEPKTIDGSPVPNADTPAAKRLYPAHA